MQAKKGKESAKKPKKPPKVKLSKEFISVADAYKQVSTEHPFDYEDSNQMVQELLLDVLLENDIDCVLKADFEQAMKQQFPGSNLADVEKSVEKETAEKQEERKNIFENDREILMIEAAEALIRKEWSSHPKSKELVQEIEADLQNLRNRVIGTLTLVEQCESRDEISELKDDSKKRIVSWTSYWELYRIQKRLREHGYEKQFERILENEEIIKKEAGIYYKNVKPAWAEDRKKLQEAIEKKAKELK